MRHILSIIIVTHNSANVIARCIEGIDRQLAASKQVIIVDSGSDETSYLEPYTRKKGYEVHCRENIGFSAANNFGLRCLLEEPEYILFINPDTFLLPGSVQAAVSILAARKDAAVLAGRLKGYDLKSDRETGLLDSTGIFRTWYGRWYDRGQGQADVDNFRQEEQVPAVCGAFMFCRFESLQSHLPELFDESFFMYKEDIDLCLRLRKQGWTLIYSPAVEAYHARGWAKNRSEMSYPSKFLAARNEVKLASKHRSPYLLWALGKYLLVRLLRV